MGKRYRMNYRAMVTALVAFLVGVLVGMLLIYHSAIAPFADGHTTAPRCTDAIADAGGICWGEPVSAILTTEGN